MSFPYKNPISPIQILGSESISREKSFGTNYSTLSIGGYMEVYSLDQLNYTIPTSTYGPINYSGNSIPVMFSKGSGTTFSIDTLTLNPDNISSGRKKLGMLVYVKDQDQVYQFNINNYETLWNAATGATGTGGSTVIISDFGTTVKANSPEGIAFISGWTANTIDGVSGVSQTNAVWKKYYGTNLAVTGGTYSSGTLTLNNVTGGTTSISGFGSGVTGFYLPLSGGTVTGGTIFTSGVTANTLNVTGLTQTRGVTSTGGITFKQVTINSSYTATTDDYMIDVTGGTFTVSLPTAIGIQGRLLVVKNNGGGAVTVDPYGSETIDGKPFVILGETNSIQLASNGSEWVALGYNISTVNSSTGVFQFTGLSIASTTTFNVAPVKGWIVNDTTNPLSPQLYYIDYSGGTHTATYVTTSTETWVYLTSGGTISQSNIELTEQQRRQNIFLGKLGHANKTNIINAFSQPDFVLSPLSQLRDMFTPINLINGGIYASPNGVNLSFNTSAGYLYGLGINFASSTLNPNTLYVAGTSPCTFQYRTQTGGTASNTTFIDPTKWDVGGVVTSITGTKATNQRIYLVQNGIFRVQYGQTEYNQLTAAIEGIATEQFNTFSNFTNNGILIGILSVLSTATNLSDTSKARFFFTSKFGETVGAAGGISTTTLQQAYNNSVTPEITTNSLLGPLSVKNGTGNADNVTKLLEGLNTAGSTTSFINADGGISGSSISAVTYYNLPTDIRVTGATYSNNTFTYTNNTGGTFSTLFNTLTGVTINGNLTVTGTTTSGNGSFTKAGFATGDVLLDNNGTDTPGVLFYYANNSNYGIDSWNGSFDVLSGQLIRITNKLNETGGAVKMAIDTSGNIAVGGFVKVNAWRPGQVVNDIMLSNTEVTISTTTIATSTSDTDFLTYSYTPLSSTSYLVIHYHLGAYTFNAGTGNDSYFSRIKVDGGEIVYSNQSTVNGNRTGVLFPLIGRYTNSNTTAKSIVVACRRDSADDSISIVNSSTSMWLRITEIAR